MNKKSRKGINGMVMAEPIDIFMAQEAPQPVESPPPPAAVPQPPPPTQQAAPQEAAVQQSGTPMPKGQKPPKAQSLDAEFRKEMLKKVIIVIVVAAVIGAIGYLSYGYIKNFLKPINKTQPTPTVNKSILSGCTAITSSGTYYLSGNINTSIKNGACILISSSNVRFLGKGKVITGSGPFISSPPFSYGIKIANVTNVTIQNLTIYKFSYDVYLANVAASKIYNVTSANATLTGIYLLNTVNSTLYKNQIYGTAGAFGGLLIQGGKGNIVTNDIVGNNAYVGIEVNSTNNTFINQSMIGNPIDIKCDVNAYFKSSNKFSTSKCSNNLFCNFAYCAKRNQPYDISKLRLAPKVSTCGSISGSGSYSLSSGLNLRSYVNVSNPLSSNSACITVNASNVKLDCAGNSIYNSRYGILVSNDFNVSVINCNLTNNTYGIYSSGSFSTNINRTAISNSNIGAYYRNTTGGVINNVTYKGNKYGLYINLSTALLLNRINANNNTYGVYYAGGGGNAFNGGSFISNYRDLYCSANTYNSTTNLFEQVNCGNTDCNWASTCKARVFPPLAVFNIAACGVINVSGSYALSKSVLTNLSTGRNCIVIKTDGVSLNCNNHLIAGTGNGNGILVVNHKNITIQNCFISKFSNGIFANNTANSAFTFINVTNSTNGFNIRNSTYETLAFDNAVPNINGFLFNSTSYSIILNNSESSGTTNSSGFIISNSYNNIIENNKAQNNRLYGYELANSRANIVANNTASGNSAFDYYCLPGSTGIYAELGGINSGLTKSSCAWALVLPPSSTAQCFAISTAQSVVLTQDMLYTFGGSCYTVFDQKLSSADGTTINCNGHTVGATNGGTFVDVVNATSVNVQNCYLIGFNTGILSTADNTTVINNTIATVNRSVSINGGARSTVKNNVILNASYGVFEQNANYGTIQNNLLGSTNIGIDLVGGTSASIINNIAQKTVIGLYLINSITNQVQNNVLLNATAYGIYCGKGSTNSSSVNRDFGGNVCSGNYQCSWMTSSPQCPRTA